MDIIYVRTKQHSAKSWLSYSKQNSPRKIRTGSTYAMNELCCFYAWLFTQFALVKQNAKRCSDANLPAMQRHDSTAE